MGTNSQQGRKKDLLPFQLELKDRTVSLELYPVLQGWSKLSIRYSPGGNFMQVNAILGVDISKKKFDACLLINNKERHKVFHNNKEGFEKLVA